MREVFNQLPPEKQSWETNKLLHSSDFCKAGGKYFPHNICPNYIILPFFLFQYTHFKSMLEKKIR